jgi:hypothetical protein
VIVVDLVNFLLLWRRERLSALCCRVRYSRRACGVFGEGGDPVGHVVQWMVTSL